MRSIPPLGHPERRSSSANQTSQCSSSLELCTRPATNFPIAVTLSGRAEGSEVERV